MTPDSAVLLVIAEMRARLAETEETNAALRAELEVLRRRPDVAPH